jgi:hypothetical protein
MWTYSLIRAYLLLQQPMSAHTHPSCDSDEREPDSLLISRSSTQRALFQLQQVVVACRRHILRTFFPQVALRVGESERECVCVCQCVTNVPAFLCAFLSVFLCCTRVWVHMWVCICQTSKLYMYILDAYVLYVDQHGQDDLNTLIYELSFYLGFSLFIF